MKYIENPKTKGSGILAAIPQTGHCPNNCADCFFQSGRSYLEPLAENLPNMPPLDIAQHQLVRVNDGNDSNIERELVMKSCAGYPMRFYNTAIPRLDFDAPVVLTLNPGKMTDKDFHRVKKVPPNLMFVRFRTNTWNIELLIRAREYYMAVPFCLTFMAYYQEADSIPADHRDNYEFRKRILNSYWCIKSLAKETVMRLFRDDPLAWADHDKGCRYCGMCLREYFATMERLRGK